MAVDWDNLVIGPTIACFGDPVQYEACGGWFPITGVFDEAYLELTPLGKGEDGTEAFSLGSPGAITTARPVLGVQLSQFVLPPEQNDTLTIMGGKFIGGRYVVKEVRPDGHGGAKLLLNEYGG